MNIEKANKITKDLRSERDYLLSREYVVREAQAQIANQIDTDVIKVITGPRRAGKSTLGLQVLSQFEDFFYINFDNFEVLELDDLFTFIKTQSAQFKNGKVLFLDEIQNVDKFELLVTQLQRNGFNITLTGSNSNLLSRELATNLTGRYVSFEVLPFSYNEALKLDSALTYLDYIKIGGFPEQAANREIIHEYVSTLFESIVIKDIIGRYNLRNVGDLSKLSDYLLKTPSQVTSYNKLTNKLRLSSVNTTIDYFDYLQEAYLLYKLHYYSPKTSEIIKSSFKTFLIDTGVFLSNPYLFEQNIGYLFENAVFLELIRAGFTPQKDLFQYKNTQQKEIDYYCKQDGNDLYVQVSLSVKDNETREREFEVLRSVNDSSAQKLVVVLEDEVHLSEGDIQVIRVEEFIHKLKNI